MSPRSPVVCESYGLGEGRLAPRNNEAFASSASCGPDIRSEAGSGPSPPKRRKPSVPKAARKWQGGAGRNEEQLLRMGECTEINRLSKPWKPEWSQILTAQTCLVPI